MRMFTLMEEATLPAESSSPAKAQQSGSDVLFACNNSLATFRASSVEYLFSVKVHFNHLSLYKQSFTFGKRYANSKAS